MCITCVSSVKQTPAAMQFYCTVPHIFTMTRLMFSICICIDTSCMLYVTVCQNLQTVETNTTLTRYNTWHINECKLPLYSNMMTATVALNGLVVTFGT